ncbi:phage tail assembly protein T [Paludisphaera borealis]|uniref:Minor tail T domain-containing protein n=1 Tax=Paludisphaera borealis TaxID=1387353 RepID=A0A1U7CNJ8_9BACT|nr:hypothetical protein [Paludisphaera borealis]APW60488.1 hypothetical protein BSF38_01958 [Paludisphaera borealis]
MPASEFIEWKLLSRMECWPDAHFDAALICSAVANFVGGNKTTADDFYPEPAKRGAEPSGRRPTAEESAGILGRRFQENNEAALKRIAAMGRRI